MLCCNNAQTQTSRPNRNAKKILTANIFEACMCAHMYIQSITKGEVPNFNTYTLPDK